MTRGQFTNYLHFVARQDYSLVYEDECGALHAWRGRPPSGFVHLSWSETRGPLCLWADHDLIYWHEGMDALHAFERFIGRDFRKEMGLEVLLEV